MALFQSDKMGFFSLITSREYAYDVLNELGENSAVQFLDMNGQEPSFTRPYSNYVRRCEDMESKLHTISDYMKKFGLKSHPCEDPAEFLRNLKYSLSARNRAEKTYLDEVEAEIEDRMAALNEQVKAYENFVEKYNHLVEFREVLQKTRPYIGGAGVDLAGAGAGAGGYGYSRDIRFNYLAGVINKEDSLRFRRILFRITRGMTFTALVDIERPADAFLSNYFIDSSKEAKPKTVFVVVYQGGEHEMLKGKLNRICDSFGASKYGIPEDQAGFDKKLYDIENQIGDAKNVIQVTRGHVETVLRYFSEPSSDSHSYSHYEGLRLFVRKEKTLYHNLNMLRPQQALVRGNCWCPLDRVQDVQLTLQELNRKKSEMGGCEFQPAPVPHGISPPTHFKTNDFTHNFQEIVNTYGIPRYREINPGLFTIATFPFLFGIMFGDIGHGGLLFVAGLYLVFFKDSIEKNKDSLWNMALPARYLLAMQGFFALFCGLVYNDFMAIPLNLFGTCYTEVKDGVRVAEPKCHYPFGLDIGWYDTANELTFLNSFKMKLAIILGVSQMTFGILLRGLNNIFTRKWLDFIFEFIPMLILMSVTFGYMVFLIFIKWTIPWGTEAYPTSKAPSIITIFIKMALSPGHWDETLGYPLYGDKAGNTQAFVQLIFLLLAVTCSLLILIPKPLILYFTHKKQSPQQDYTLQNSDHSMTQNLLQNHAVEDNQLLIDPTPERQQDMVRKVEQGHPEHEHFDMGEIFVHQIIETIEFVLGTISNTASYLRLWALSLAHSQLAKVFLNNTLGRGIESGNFLVAFFTFWLFANITYGVLMLMDQMECFLHALRLHWVEFQNKFYKADGYLFDVFSFEKSLKNSSDSDRR